MSLDPGIAVIPSAASAPEEPSAAQRVLDEAERLLSGSPSEAVSLARKAAERAMDEGDQLLLARAHLVYGIGLRRLGDLVSAQGVLNDAEALFVDIGDTLYLPRLWQARATIYNAAGELDQAIECLAQAMPLARKNEDVPTLQRILSTWAVVAMRKGEFTQAIALLEEDLQLLEEYPDDGLRTVVLNAYGSIYQRTKNFEVALQYFGRSLDILRARRNAGHKDSRNHCSSLICIADTLLSMGRSNEAAEYLDEALLLAREHELLDVQASVMKAFGDRAMGEDNFSVAVQHYTDASDLLEATGNGMIMITVLNQMGDAYLRLNDLQNAEQILTRALELERNTPSPEHECETHRSLARVFESRKDYRRSSMHYKLALQNHERLFSGANQRVLQKSAE